MVTRRCPIILLLAVGTISTVPRPVLCFVLPRCNVSNNLRTRSITYWTAGDVEADFERLENAIRRDSAEEDLLAQQRVDTMDYAARSRKEISNELLSFMKGPLLLSFTLSLIFRGLTGSKVLAWVNAFSIAQFFVGTVIVPLVLLAIRSRKQVTQEIELPRSIAGLGDHYLKFLTNYENPRLSCRDTVLCLLEMWSFAVLPSMLYRPWTITRRLFTRLGAWASMRQYPVLSYKLWHQQPQPLSGMVVALRTVSKMMSSKFMFALDVALLLSQRLHQQRIILYTYGVLFLVGSLSYLGFTHISPRNKVWRSVYQFRPPIRLMVGSAVLGSIWKQRRLIIDSLSQPVSTLHVNLPVYLSRFCWMSLLSTTLAVVSYAGVAWNLTELKQNTRIAYTHNLSMSTLLTDDQGNDGDPDVDSSSFRWRYWHSWRDPVRIYQRLGSLYGNFWHWLLLEGRVEDQMARARRQKRPFYIFELAETDNFTLEDKSQWKARALNTVAERHRLSVEDKSCLDPLGIAVYLSLGIGLDFAFDHMKPPPEGTAPSTRLLQARAAKSAQKRAVELLDAEGVRTELAKIADPEQRKKCKIDMRKQTQDELDYLARRLIEMIPRKSSISSIDDIRSRDMYRTLLKQRERSPSVQRFLEENTPKTKLDSEETR